MRSLRDRNQYKKTLKFPQAHKYVVAIQYQKRMKN